MKKTLTSIVLGLASVIACAQTPEAPTKFWEGVKNLRVNAEMKCGEDVETLTGNYSTAGVIFQDGERTYYHTNKHAVGMIPVPPLGCEILSAGYVLSEGTQDEDYDDDLLVKIEGVSTGSDLAIISTRRTQSHAVPRVTTPILGEMVYMIGWPNGYARMLDVGVVASERDDRYQPKNTFGPGWWLNSDLTMGESGSPAYVRRKDGFKLAGVVAGGLSDKNTTYMVDAKEAKMMMNMIRMKKAGDGW